MRKEVKMIQPEKTGTLIAALRHEHGLTQRQLAERLHISDKTVSKWERGQSLPDISLLLPLADFFGVSVDSLLRDPDQPPCPKWTSGIAFCVEPRYAKHYMEAVFRNHTEYSFARLKYQYYDLDQRGNILDYGFDSISNFEPGDCKRVRFFISGLLSRCADLSIRFTAVRFP